MDSKDAQESLESGGGGARCRCSNGRRTAAAVLIIQSLLTAACAAFSLKIFLNQQQQQTFSQDSGIFMQMLDVDSDELRFTAIWNQSVDLNNQKRVKLSCAGPYVVYLWACVKSYGTQKAVNLTLKQENKLERGNKLEQENKFHLEPECQEMQSVFMLSNNSEVTVKVEHLEGNFKIERLFLGLHYMLGAQCFSHPLEKLSNPEDVF